MHCARSSTDHSRRRNWRSSIALGSESREIPRSVAADRERRTPVHRAMAAISIAVEGADTNAGRERNDKLSGRSGGPLKTPPMLADQAPGCAQLSGIAPDASPPPIDRGK